MNESSSLGQAVYAGGLGNAPSLTPYFSIQTERAKNGFVIRLGYETHVAKDNAELLALITEYLK